MKSRPGRERRKQKRATQDAKRRKRFDRVLSLLGLAQGFRLLPKEVRAAFLRLQLPKPEVALDASADGHPVAQRIRDEIVRFVDEAEYEVDAGTKLSLADYCSAFMALRHGFMMLQVDPSLRQLSEYVAAAKRTTAEFHARHNEGVVRMLLDGVDPILVPFCNLGREIFWAKVAVAARPSGKKVLTVTIGVEKPQVIQVGLDGKAPQPAYRCGGSLSSEGLHWVRWTSKAVGRNEDDREYPVYVLEHALERLRERVPIKGAPLEDFLWLSLREPRFVPARRSDERLVEYRLYQHRLGYLPVRILSDKVVVKTFLFLTMSGTPEQRQLYERLRLIRPDIEEKYLDRLTLYLMTDIQNDPLLRRAFEECGCGHLFDMVKPEFRAECHRGFADDLRRFLGLDAGPGAGIPSTGGGA